MTSMIMDDADILTDTIAIQLDIGGRRTENPRICRRQERPDYIEQLSLFEENQILDLEHKLSRQVEEK